MTTLTNSVWLLASILLPLFVFAFLVHRLEILVQIRLAERFGWKVVLWTGWLGTPLHELSHAAMCVIFRHKIHEIKLFEPDLKTGRLGYVKHSWKKNWYEEVGNVFIGIAPLIGGTIGLVVLLFFFYPDVTREAAEVLRREAAESVWTGTLEATGTILRGICTWTNLFTARFWLFIYLVLCVGAHMGPSRSDYEGARKGIVTLAFIVIVAVVGLYLVTGNSENVLPSVMETMAPVFAVFLLALLLCLVATIVIFLVTIPFKQKYTFKPV